MKYFYLPVAILGIVIASGFGFILDTQADVHSEPTIYLYPSLETATSTTYQVLLAQNTLPLNVFEFTLEFASSSVVIVDREIESALCRPELTVADEYDSETGIWYVACGNYQPFAGTDLVLATFTIVRQADEYSWLRFGANTNLYVHNGLGTQITPRTLPWLHNYSSDIN